MTRIRFQTGHLWRVYGPLRGTFWQIAGRGRQEHPSLERRCGGFVVAENAPVVLVLAGFGIMRLSR